MGLRCSYTGFSIKMRKNAHMLVQALSRALPAGGRKKALLLNYTGFEANHGCMATSGSLQGIIKKSWPGAAVRLEPIGFEPPGTFIPADPSRLDEFLPEFMASERKWFRSFDWADVIILNGEGSMHEYSDPNLNQCFLARLIQLYAGKKVYKKRVMVVNQTMEFTENYDGIVKKCLEGLDLVSVREPRSYERLSNIGLGNMRLSADAAFLVKGVDDARGEEILDRKALSRGFVCVFLSETISGCRPEKTADLILGLEARFKKDVLLAATTRVDLDHVQRVSRMIKVRTLGLEVSPGELVSVLKHSSVVLSGRYHCCIFAFLAGAPLVPFASNSYKIEGLVKLMCYPSRVYDYGADPNDLIIEAVEDKLLRSGPISRLILRELARVRTLAQSALTPPRAMEGEPW